MKTLLLDIGAWDLILDAHGDIAVAANPYALAQDAASAIKTRKGEAWYDVSLGVRYKKIQGISPPPIELMRADFIAAAKTVPEVVAAQCFITAIINREVGGQIQVTDKAGVITAAAF